ncbi:MAG: anti-sigma factor [Actinomycetota bacterium]
MDCLATRDRLTEYAVSTLSSHDLGEVEAHLQWCAGCRKEARELREAAAMVGMSLPQSELPSELEQRVVRGVRSAAVRGHPSKGRTWVRRSLTILAAVIGILGMTTAGWLFARQQPLENQLRTSERQAKQFAERLNAFLTNLPVPSTQPHDVSRAVLITASGGPGGGGAVRVTSTHFEDIVLVTVGGLPQTGAPYRAWLAGVSGKRLYVGKLSNGDSVTEREFIDDLRLYRYVEVRDQKGRLVLKGAFNTTA